MPEMNRRRRVEPSEGRRYRRSAAVALSFRADLGGRGTFTRDGDSKPFDENPRREPQVDEGSRGRNVFRELEAQNPAVARAFRTYRRHGELLTFVPGSDMSRWMPEPCARPPLSMLGHPGWAAVVGVALLLIGIGAAAIAVGPEVVRFVAMHWQATLLPICAACLGAGVTILVSRVGASPLPAVAPPKADAEDTLQELKNLAERTGARLRAAYRLQLWTVVAVGTVFISLIVWSIVMVSQRRILYASAFGSSSVAMAILTKWKWQPFERINEARRLADNADTLATGLRLRMKTIYAITDPSRRAKAQWDAVKEYLECS